MRLKIPFATYFRSVRDPLSKIAVMGLIGLIVIVGKVEDVHARQEVDTSSTLQGEAERGHHEQYPKDQDIHEAATAKESQSKETKESNMKNAGDKGNNFASLGMLINAGVGGYHVWEGKKAAAAGNKGEAAMHFGLATLNFGQMAADGATAGGAGQAADSASSDGMVDDGISSGTKNSGKHKMKAQAAAAQRELSQLGYRYDPNSKKVVTPDGTFSPGDYASPEAAKRAGMSSQSVAALGKILANEAGAQQKILDELKAAGADGVQMGGGGAGGGGGGSSSSKSSDRWGDGSARSGKRSVLRSPGSLEGMKKFVGQDRVPVGVSVDNIFEMVRRKYRLRDQNRGFL